jgi:hypothetical protein
MGERIHRGTGGGITGDSVSFEEADSDGSGTLSQEELEALTVSQLRAIATEMGYTLTATKKDEIIAEILAQQA